MVLAPSIAGRARPHQWATSGPDPRRR